VKLFWQCPQFRSITTFLLCYPSAKTLGGFSLLSSQFSSGLKLGASLPRGDSVASLLVPVSLLVIGWLVVQILSRRNERRLQAEWQGFVRNYEEWVSEDVKSLPCPEPDSWGLLSKRCFTVQIIRNPELPVIRFVYGALFEYFPNRCWVCQKLILERNTRYRKDDVQHLLEEERLRFPIFWLPRPYCMECLEALGFATYRESRSPLKPKA
jgi:hypothetical protein